MHPESWWVKPDSPRVQHQLPGVEKTEVEVHMATYSLFAIDHRWQVAYTDSKKFDDDGGRSCFR